jgi:large subunit ribosomal protein L25
MDTTLAATKRNESGKGGARKLRAAGKMPAVLYGIDSDTISLAVDPKQLTDIFQGTQNRNTVLQLDIDGTTVPALVREAQRHPVSRDILHVDFQQVGEKPVEVMIPVTTTGKPAGAVLGGRLRLIRRELKVRCNYANIPFNFQVDVSDMQIGDIIKASEIDVPDGVQVVYTHDFNVLTLYGKKASAAVAEDAEVAEEEQA